MCLALQLYHSEKYQGITTGEDGKIFTVTLYHSEKYQGITTALCDADGRVIEYIVP